MGKPMADYVKLPELEEYKEWFKDFADLYREDGILQVTWKTLDGPMHHSGMSHRAISQLVRVLSLDYKNEIIIFTHIGDHWMTESDPNGWETYSELPTQRFQHQYFDDTNLIKNMVFDLDVPTIGAIPGSGFHWDSAMLSDITICSEDTWMEVPHAHGGLVPGDGMGLMAQHYFGTKRGNYYMMTARQWTAQLDVFIVDFRHIADDVGQRRTVRIVTTFIAFNFNTRKTVLIDGKASYLYFGQVSFHRNGGETV